MKTFRRKNFILKFERKSNSFEQVCGTRFTENSKYVKATFLGGLLTQLKVEFINFVANTKVFKFDDLPKTNKLNKTNFWK